MKPRVSQSFRQPWSLKLGLDRVTNVLDPCQRQGTRQVTQKIKSCWLQLPSCRSKEKSLVTENGSGTFNLCKYSAKVPGFSLIWLYLGGKKPQTFIWSLTQQRSFLWVFSFEKKVPFSKKQPKGEDYFPQASLIVAGDPTSAKTTMKERMNFSLAWFNLFLIKVQVGNSFAGECGGFGVTTNFLVDPPCLMPSFQSIFQSELLSPGMKVMPWNRVQSSENKVGIY